MEETDLSRKLSKSMSKRGQCAFNTQLLRKRSLILEFTNTFFQEYDTINTGGSAEGTNLSESSDRDIMRVLRNVLIVKPNDKSIANVIELVSVTNDCLPGYTILHPKSSTEKNSFKENDSKFDDCRWILKSRVNKDGSGYVISSEKFKEVTLHPCPIPADSFEETGFTANGPAKKIKTMLIDVDYVPALEFKDWPESAIKWLKKERVNNWPSPELLYLCKIANCYTVPTGDKLSEHCGVQWRLSFVAIERELVWSMNDTQLQCFYLLKKILKELIAPKFPDQITTYHMKTITFWLCEEMPADSWREENLVKRVRDGLTKLQECIKERNLSQYIIPENNLFRNVLNDKTIQELVLEAVEDLLKGLKEYLNIDVEEMNKTLLKFSSVDGCNYMSELWNYVNTCRLGVPYRPTGIVTSCEVEKYYKAFQTEFDDEDLLLPSISLAIGRAMYLETVDLKQSDSRKVKLEEAIKQIKTAKVMDMLSVPLEIAMVYVREQSYELALKHLETAIPKEGHYLFIGGVTEDYYYLTFPAANKIDKQLYIRDIRESTSTLLSDVNVGLGEIALVPNPIMLECITTITGILCHQVVVAYFLRFISEHHLGCVAEKKYTLMLLSSAVMNTHKHKWYYAHLNVLGYCYHIIGKLEMAFHMYVLSLREYPSVVNSAAYLLAFMANDKINGYKTTLAFFPKMDKR